MRSLRIYSAAVFIIFNMLYITSLVLIYLRASWVAQW